MKRGSVIMLVACGLIVAAGGLSAVAAVRPVAGAKDGATEDRMRARIEQALTKNREQEARLEEALAMLNRGEPAEQIAAHMREGLADGPGPEGRPSRGPGGDGPGAGRFGAGRFELTDERAERLLSLLEEVNPRLHERVQRIWETDREKGRQALLRAAPRLIPLIELRERDPEAFEMKMEELRNGRQIFDLLREVRDAKPDELTQARLDQIRAELVGLVGHQFDLRARHGLQEAERLSRRLERFQAELEERATNRDGHVQQRADELLRRALEGGILGGDEEGFGPGPEGEDGRMMRKSHDAAPGHGEMRRRGPRPE